MGAHNFHTVDYGKNPQEAYDEAVNKAVYDYGHDPYNGTISTTYGFAMVPLKKGESYDEWAHRILDHPGIEKRGDCACVAGAEKDEWHFAGWAAS